MDDPELLQVIPAGVSVNAEQLHILLTGPEPDPDGKYQTEEAHNQGKRIELMHFLRFYRCKYKSIYRKEKGRQSLFHRVVRQSREFVSED
jgi:hypothetical protein